MIFLKQFYVREYRWKCKFSSAKMKPMDGDGVPL